MSGITDGPVTSLALCWTIERRDGAGLALTSHDAAVTAGDLVYEPNPGMAPASVIRRLGLEPAASEVSGALSSSGLTERDLAQSRWDGARVTLRVIDWAHPEAPAIELLHGEIGEIVALDEAYSAELHGVAAKLSVPVCPVTTPECRAELGDRDCRVDMAGRTLRAKVLGAAGNRLVVDTAVDQRFVFGRLRFLGGANTGLSSIVLGASGASVELRDWPRETVEPGCAVELREGCDKQFATCAGRFGNAENFRGEPHLPGNDLLTRYPGG